MKNINNKLQIRSDDLFESLPDELVISILCKLTSTVSSPSDFISVLKSCKRLNKLALNPFVLSVAGTETFSIRAKNWCDEAHRFLKLFANAGNIEAYYALGMIRFYCLQHRGNGASLMARAASKAHAPALYSLALIQFNGSGGVKNDKDLRAGVALCARSAFLGHVDALRELGHCFQDGYGVRKNDVEGRRLLVQANAREFACSLRAAKMSSLQSPDSTCSPRAVDTVSFKVHPANRFLIEWFGLRDGPGSGLRMCSSTGCGRPETRKSEFRRCSGCEKVNYCSRGCQARDWRVHHKLQCAPIEEWNHVIDDVEEDEEVGDDDRTVEIEGMEGYHGGLHV